jgi:SAM-dependent methyltransferase
MANRTLDSYDQIPYLSHPLPQTHPSRLAAIAAMFGLSFVPPRKARVLEMGCASGVNLLGMAHFMPESEFVGIDLSAVQINEAKQRAQALKANNVTYHHMNIEDIDSKFGEFDYIIAHGVFSWIPTSTQKAILRVCNENLSTDGIAFVSYNVLPGWRMKQAARDALVALTPPDMPPQKRLEYGVSWIKEAMTLTEKDEQRPLLHQSLVTEIQELLTKKDIRYLTHEYLEAHNDPILFTDFLAQAREAGMAYLGDAEPASMVRHITNPTLRDFFQRHPTPGITYQEQAMDIISGRTFRQSLLVKSVRQSKMNRALTSAFFNGLYINTRILKSTDSDGKAKYKHIKLGELNAHGASGETILELLTTTSYKPIEYKVLTEKYLEKLPDSQEAVLSDTLFTLLGAGALDIFAEPCLPDLAPGANTLAILDVESNRNVTTNAIGEAIGLDPFQQILIPLLTETWDKEAAIAKLEDLHKKGAFNINPVPTEEQIKIVLGGLIDQSINALKQHGIAG